MTVVTRFAPSPTGFLHIGGARTALFNWLYSRHHGGRFLLRIEDTDKQRSTIEAIEAIFQGLNWLGLDWHGDAVFQSARAERHAEVAHQLLAQGNAYRCYCTPEELAAMREEQRKAGQSTRYDGRWRDRDPSEAPPGVAPTIRLRAPQTGDTIVEDAVQGTVRVDNAQLDDMVLLRGDGTPTYMLSVVVDDRDMGITQIIRGDDHLTNTFRQVQISRAMGWEPPRFAHIPLIHGPDGAKLSKRHGALGVDAYRDMGFLPEAMRNYLLRLGWSHGDDEMISTEQAVGWFDLDGVGRSPSRFDFAKLTNLNAHYIRERDPGSLLELIKPRLEEKLGHTLDESARARLLRGIVTLQPRARTLVELAEAALFYVAFPLPRDEKTMALLRGDRPALLARLADALQATAAFDAVGVEALARGFAEREGMKLGDVAQPLRAAITCRTASPPIFEVMEILGREETVRRLRLVVQEAAAPAQKAG
jgi:glutamyl-tRNA synthetase